MVIVTGNTKPLATKLLKIGKKRLLNNIIDPMINFLASKIIIMLSITISTAVLVTTGNIIPLISSISSGTKEIVSDISKYKNKKAEALYKDNTIHDAETPEAIKNEVPAINENKPILANINTFTHEEKEIVYYEYIFRTINHNNIDSLIITDYIGKNNIVEIPYKFSGQLIIAIDNKAFNNKNISKLIFTGNIISIGNEAFSNNKIATLNIPETIKTIGKDAFFNNRINSVKFPANLELIDSRAFMNNKIQTIDIPNKITGIAAEVFSNNLITEIIIPDNIKSIGFKAFNDNPIINIKIGKNVIMDINSFPNEFQAAYEKNGRKSGEYIFEEKTWFFINEKRRIILHW